MPPSSRALVTLIVACSLTACALPNAARRTGSGTAAEGVVHSAVTGKKVTLPTPKPDQVATNGAGLVSNNGAGIISNASGGLSGFVRCPASLVGNNGAGIISDNGLGLISNNSGSYHVFADSDVALKGATVTLLDAGGAPVKGTDGQPLTAKTDESGHYQFSGVTPVNNLILTVNLGTRGQLTAIAPKSGDAQRKSDLNVISTLTTRYILSQYVAGQADPQKTLDKLPVDVESDTRQKAAAAFAASGQATPSDLKDATVTQIVTQLRQKDTTFDAQMETVKKILVAAGLSDLGNGQKATDVLLNNISHVLSGPDGSVYFFDGVLWRVTPQGMLVRLTTPGPADTTLQGRKAADCKVGLIKQLSIDPQGRLWFLTDAADPKLWRIEADGTLNEMTHGISKIYLFTPTGNDDYLALQAPTSWGQPMALYQSTGTATPTVVYTFTGNDASIVFQLQQLARDSQGRLIGAGLVGVIPKSYRFDLTTKTLSLVKGAMTDGVGTVALDAVGNLFYDIMATHETHLITPSGTDTVVAGLNHLPYTEGITRMPDGSIIVKGAQRESSLYQLKSGQETLYAGKEAQTTQTGNTATATALKAPTGLAVAADGTLYVTDAGALLRFHATEGASTLVAVDSLKDGDVSIVPLRPQVSPDGWAYFIGQTSTFLAMGVPYQGVWRVKPGGTPERVYTPADRHVQDYLLNADGSITCSESTPASMYGTTDRITTRSATGTVTTLIADDQRFINQMSLARDAQGRLLMFGARKGTAPNTFDFYRIFRFSDAGIEMLPADTFLPEARNAKGQEAGGYYYSDPAVPKAIRLYTPATGKLETLTGPGNRFFSGTGVDDGVIKPIQPSFDAQGNLYFLDPDNKQVKRIAGSDL